jgi:hypothetical protein
MVRDAQNAVGDASEQPPRMLRQPADAPAPLGRVGDTESLLTVRRVRANWEAQARRSLRSWVGRVSGRSDRHLLRALADATDALADHCDLLADRLAGQEAVSADVAGTLGEEVSRLRAEVLHLQRLLTSTPGSTGG